MGASQNEIESKLSTLPNADDIKTPDVSVMSIGYKEVNIEDIDTLLDEIAQKEKQYEIDRMNTTDDENVDWNEIMDALRTKNTNYIKNKLSSKQIGVNAQNPENGRTLLIYAVVIGDYDLVKAILNVGADVSIKDKQELDALDYAIKFGQYKITELVYYRQLSGKTGNDLKEIKTEIFKKKKEAKYIKKTSPDLTKEITEFMIAAITEREAFDPSMLFYAWYFNENSLTSPLWTVMMETYEQILSDTKDKNGWKWLKENFSNSLIWFLKHPHFVLFNKERLQRIENKFNAKADGEELEVKFIKTENVPKMIESLGYFPFSIPSEKQAQKVQIKEFEKIIDPNKTGKVAFHSFIKMLKTKYAPSPIPENENEKEEKKGDDDDDESEEDKMEN